MVKTKLLVGSSDLEESDLSPLYIGRLDSVNGIVDWNAGMERWNGLE